MPATLKVIRNWWKYTFVWENFTIKTAALLQLPVSFLYPAKYQQKRTGPALGTLLY